MMKNFKLFLLSFVLIAGFLTSCTNNDSIVEEQNIDETEAITESLNRLAQQFNDEGDVIPTSNPAGNIVFDFCFDFVYPLNLSYNNGTTVSVSSLDDLITILINSTDDLYINGVEFPFNVETYNDDTGAIEIVTINNENEFYDLLEDCDFDGIDSCDCDDDINPVCVEVQDPSGESFIITYPNECYAMCDGFTPNDFAENCEDDYNCPGGNECFEFNYPITIITDDQQTITINSQEELDNALYNVYYFDFVYPFDVTLTDGTVATVSNENDFVALLEDCFDYGDCPCTAEVNIVCVEVEGPNGETEIISFLNGCEAECAGFSDADFIDCDNTNPDYCTEQELLGYLLECDWYINTSLYNTVNAEYAQFSQDGSLEIISQGSASGISGTWDVTSNPSTAQLFMSFGFNDAPYDAISQLDWTVTQCSEYFIVLESGNEFIQLERNCDNNGSDCNEETISDLLVQCQFWSVTISNQGYIYVFGNDGTVTVGNSAGNSVATGTWSTSTNSDGDVVVNVNTNSGNFSSDWTFLSCSINGVIIVESSATWMSNIESGCN